MSIYKIKVGDIISILSTADGELKEVEVTFISNGAGFLVKGLKPYNVKNVYLFSEFEEGRYKLFEEVISLENI